GVDVDDVASVHVLDVALEGEGACIFHGVEEDRGDLAADAHAAVTLVGNVRDVVADVPEYGVGGRFARGAGTDHIANQGNGEALLLQFLDLGSGIGDTFAWHLVHGQRVQWNVRT